MEKKYQLFQDLELTVHHKEADGCCMNMFDLKGISTWTKEELFEEGHVAAVDMKALTDVIVEALSKALPPEYGIEFCVTERRRGDFETVEGTNRSAHN